MFDVDVSGLFELEGGKPPYRLAMEPIANVFDEYRGYEEGRKRPTFCALTANYSPNPRGVMLRVEDDGAGFTQERDIWTLFGTTSKRSAAGVSGRFNAGDKQLIAAARSTTIRTNNVTVTFAVGKRDVVRHRSSIVDGTIVEALMPWSLQDLAQLREQMLQIIPPDGLKFTVDGRFVERPQIRCSVRVALPTVLLTDGVMRTTVRKATVHVVKTETPRLYELGLPICDLTDVGFPWSLDVGQKIPVPMSRDSVSPGYLFRAIGCVLEQAALDGHSLLTPEEEGASFVKMGLDWIREPVALKATLKSIYGDKVVRPSKDSIANAKAAAAGAAFLPNGALTSETRRRAEENNILPTAKELYGGAEALFPSQSPLGANSRCPTCGRERMG